MVSRAKAKRTRIAEEEREHHDDHISRLPDAVLGEIVSLLPTKDGGRTQAIATRWRHLWRSAPLNLDLHKRPPVSAIQCKRLNLNPRDDDLYPVQRRIPLAQISGILASHQGPGRCFSIPSKYFNCDAHPAATLDGWLRCPALEGLQELHFDYGTWEMPVPPPLPPLPESVCRFSSTLRIASFKGCAIPDENGLQLPLLKQLSPLLESFDAN